MMAGYRFNKEEYFKETKEVYSNYPTDVSRMEEELDRLQKENPKASSFQKKTWIYRIAARDAEVILFPSVRFMQKLIQEENRTVLRHRSRHSQALDVG